MASSAPASVTCPEDKETKKACEKTEKAHRQNLISMYGAAIERFGRQISENKEIVAELNEEIDEWETNRDAARIQLVKLILGETSV